MRTDLLTVVLDVPEEMVGYLAECLSVDERERAARFFFAPDRRRFRVARGMLRHILGQYLEVAPAAVTFQYQARGKPFVPASGLHFNLSHSGERAVYALSWDRPVGVDVELARPMPDAEAIAERFFSRRECEALRGLPELLREQAFFLCWTRKEAYIKAVGEGLFTALDSFSVSLLPGEPPRLLAPAAGYGEHWSLHGWSPAVGYEAALAVPGELGELRSGMAQVTTTGVSISLG